MRSFLFYHIVRLDDIPRFKRFESIQGHPAFGTFIERGDILSDVLQRVDLTFSYDFVGS